MGRIIGWNRGTLFAVAVSVAVAVGIVRVLDQDWTNASSSERSATLASSECVKRPKSKKSKGDSSDARSDGGKSGKGGGKSGGGGGKAGSESRGSYSSSSSSTWSSASSSNMILVNSTDSASSESVSFTFSTASTSRSQGKQKGKKSKKGEKENSSARYCEDDEDETNIVGGTGGDSSKGKEDQWNNDQDEDVTAGPPSATPQDESPAASPAMMVPSGENDSGGDSNVDGSTNEDLLVPTSSPNTFPDDRSDMLPTTGNNSLPFMGQEAVCAAFASGTSPTNTPRQNHIVLIALNVAVNGTSNTSSTTTEMASSTLVESIYSQMDMILQDRIAPLLLNCVNQRRRHQRHTRGRHLINQRQRLVQQSSNRTEYVNVAFGDMQRDKQKNCTVAAAAGAQCIPSIISSDLYYLGEEPSTFGEQLRQAILFWDFDIDGLLGFGDVQVEQVVDEPVQSPPTRSPFVPPTPTAITTRSSPPVGTTAGIENSASRDRRANPGAFVAAAVAALTLVLVAVFVAKRHRHSSDSISKHREFIDDPDDDFDLGNETDDNTAMTPISSSPMMVAPKAFVIGDDESWNTGRSGQGHEIYATPGLTELLTQHGPHVQCSSPTCEACELKRQDGTKFVVASTGMVSSPSREDLPPRTYEVDDTVSL